MWTRIAVTSMIIGLMFLVVALIRYGVARGAQQKEQAVLERDWNEDVRRATQRFPPALPRARPDPAELRGMPVILGLLAGGVLLGGGGLAALLFRANQTRHVQQVRNE